MGFTPTKTPTRTAPSPESSTRSTAESEPPHGTGSICAPGSEPFPPSPAWYRLHLRPRQRAVSTIPQHANGTARICQCDPCKFSIRSEEHTSELQSLRHLVCRLLLA